MIDGFFKNWNFPGTHVRDKTILWEASGKTTWNGETLDAAAFSFLREKAGCMAAIPWRDTKP